MGTAGRDPSPTVASPLTGSWRFLGGLLCSALGALTFLPPSASSGWLASAAVRLAGEFGYLFTVPAILTFLPGWRRTAAGKFGVLLSIAAIFLLARPTFSAMETSEALPDIFSDRFGTETRVRHRFAEPARTVPFLATELLRPVTSWPVRYERISLTQSDGNELTLHVFHPPYLHGRIPALIVLHGESWAGGVSRELGALDAYLAARDYLVVAISGRLAARRSFQSARADVLATLDYLKTHASELGVDPNRLAIMGRAVAGQLALLVAYTATDPSLRGVIALYPPTDLGRWYANSGDAVSPHTRTVLKDYLGGPPEHAPQAYEAASPIKFVQRGTPPTLLVHGMRDGLIPSEQSERLATRLEEAGVKHLFVKLPWASHVCDQNFAGPCGQITTYAVERFLDAVMRRPSATAELTGWQSKSAGSSGRVR